jgi:hypothetical protein
MTKAGRILIIGVLINFSVCYFNHFEIDTARRIRDFTVPSSPEVKGEVLLRNLYALLVVHYSDISDENLKRVFPTLSQLAFTPLAEEELTLEKFGELIDQLGIRGRDKKDEYESFKDKVEKPSGDTFFGDFLHIFENHFVRLLNTSPLDSAFRFVRGLVMAENIAGQMLHELDNTSEDYFQLALSKYMWALTHHQKDGEEIKRENSMFYLDYYGDYNWDYFTPQEQNTILAATFILLEYKLHQKWRENLSRNLPQVIQDLYGNKNTRNRLLEVKETIKEMLIPENLKSELLSYFEF